MKLSVIIPAYNEAQGIVNTIGDVEEGLNETDLDYEIIVVDDGSNDKTSQEVRKTNAKVLRYDKNHGKGHALKYGFKKASGEFVIFIDADSDLHPRQIRNFLKHIDDYNADVVVGSKRHPLSKINYPLIRKILSGMYFYFFVKPFFDLGVKDTQAGLKLFKYEVLRDIFPKVMIKKYAFDLELLVNAHRQGYTIIEAPIELNFKHSSNINFTAIWHIFWDTVAIFYRLRILKYYDR